MSATTTRAIVIVSIFHAVMLCQCREAIRAKETPQPRLSEIPGKEDPITKGTFPAGFGEKRANLRVDGDVRLVDLFLPQKRAAKPALLIVLHGSGGTGRGALWKSGAIDLANSQGLIVVAPQARTMTTGDWDNHQAGEVFWQTHPNTDPEKNPDLRFMRRIVQEAERSYATDPSRVFVMGISNGGFFAVLLAQAWADKVAAFSASSSGLVRCARTIGCRFKGKTADCATLAKESGYCSCKGTAKPATISKKGRKPPAHLYHAADDDIVSIYYTCELAKALSDAGHTLSLDIRGKGGHGWPKNYATQIWPFLSQHTLNR